LPYDFITAANIRFGNMVAGRWSNRQQFAIRLQFQLDGILLVMWTIIYYMISNGFENIFSSSFYFDPIIFMTALPFLILSIILVYKLFKNIPLSKLELEK